MEYDREFRIARLVSVALMIGLLVMAAVAELFLAPGASARSWAAIDTRQLSLVRDVAYGLAVLLVMLALVLKRAIRVPREGMMRRVLYALTRNLHRRRSGTAVAILLPVAALGEVVGVLGFLLFLLGAGARTDLYPLLGVAMATMLAGFPLEREKENLMAMDLAVMQREQGPKP